MAAAQNFTITPDDFHSAWSALPEAGQFACNVGSIPSEDEVRHHFEVMGTRTIVALGTVGGMLKCYFAAMHNGELFCCELVADHSNYAISVVMKCEGADAAAKCESFAPSLKLNALFG